MGRPPTHGAPSFRFFHSEVAQMEALLQEHGGHVPSRDLLMALANKFSNSQERSGKIAVQMKQVWNWFQNRRYALRAKLVKSPGNPNVPPNTRDEAPQVRNVPPVPQQTPVPSGHNVSRNTSENPPMEFEAKSARDGAWYDVQVFLSHRYLETGNPEVLVRFSGFGPEEDEWVNIRKHVRQRSLPCESSECVAVLPGDLILCFQEGKEQALYFDAHVLDAQRRRHDVRGCRCRFLVRYDHDQTEEIVPLRKVCRRPETDYRLQQLHAANESASASASASTSTSVSAESKKPAVDPNLNSTMRVTNPNPTAAVTVPPPTITNVTASSLISTPTSAPFSASTLNSAPTPTPISAPTPTPTLTSSPNPTPIPAPTLTPISTPTPTPISAPIPPLTSASTLISAPSPSLNSAPTPSPTLISAPSPSSISAPTPSSTLISAPSPSSTPISAPTPSSTLNTAPSPSSTPISGPSPSSTPIAAPPSPTPVSASSPTPISDPSPSSAPIIAPPSSILVSAPSPTPISAASPTLVSAPPSTVVLASAPSLCPAVASAPTPTPAPVDPSPSSSPIIAPSPSPILVSASSPTPIPAASPTLISAPTSSPPSTLALASAPSLSPVIAPAPTPPPVPVSSSIPVAAPESKKLESNGSGISAVEASVQDNIIDSGAVDKIVESKKEEICVNPETSVVIESRVSQEDLSDNPTVVPVPEPEKVSEPRMAVGASTTDGALIVEENSDLTVSNAKE